MHRLNDIIAMGTAYHDKIAKLIMTK